MSMVGVPYVLPKTADTPIDVGFASKCYWMSYPSYREADLVVRQLLAGLYMVVAKFPMGSSPLESIEAPSQEVKARIEGWERALTRSMPEVVPRVVFYSNRRDKAKHFCESVERMKESARAAARKAFRGLDDRGDGSIEDQWSEVFGEGSLS